MICNLEKKVTYGVAKTIWFASRR